MKRNKNSRLYLEKNLKVVMYNMNFIEEIKKKKADISDSSAKAYSDNLRRVLNAVGGDKLSDLPKKTEAISEFLDKLKSNTKKNYLNAIIVGMALLGDEDKDNEVLQKYGKQRDELNTAPKSDLNIIFRMFAYPAVRFKI